MAKIKSSVFYYSYDLESLHSEVPPDLLPTYLGGKKEQMYECVAAAKEKEEHFRERIEAARLMYKGS